MFFSQEKHPGVELYGEWKVFDLQLYCCYYSLLTSKKDLETLNEKELKATLTHIRTTASNGNMPGPFPPYLGLGCRGYGERYILISLSFWSDCNRPIVCFHSTDYKDELLQFKIVPENKLKIKRMRLEKARTFYRILFRSIDDNWSCTPWAPQVLQDIL